MWKIIPAFGGRYEVSDDGEIRHSVRKNIRKARLNKFGYLQMNFPINDGSGRNITLPIHRLVAEAFIPNPNNLREVNHIDGNKQNNHASNLEWCTASENQKHAFRLGLQKPIRGLNNSQSKFNREQIIKIRKMYNELHFSQQKIADYFHVCATTIGRIVRGIRYADC